MTQLTAEQVRFRDCLRALFAEPQVEQIRQRLLDAGPGDTADIRPLHRCLGERGWLAAGWPRRYGGLGESTVEAAILHQELIRHGFPDFHYVVSICYVGDFLLFAGDDALKDRYLPLLARGEILGCTLYSEPGVGSDLGALAATAELVDGRYRLHGTKIYSQGTGSADYGLVAARIGEPGPVKYQGITLFWVPLRASGVTIRSVPTISDHAFSEVTFDGVEVPADHVVGPPGEGWRLLNAALTLERTGFEAHLKLRAWLDWIIARAEQTGRLGDPLVVDALVSLDTQVAAGGTLAWRMVGKQARRDIDEVGSAMSKWYNTELARPISRLALDLDGVTGVLSGAGPDGRPEAYYRESPGLTLSAGTSEIMLYTIATGHLRTHSEDAKPSSLDDPHPQFRRRLAGLVRTGLPNSQSRRADAALRKATAASGTADDWLVLTKSNIISLTLPREAGGLGRTLDESLVVAEELGKVLHRSPYLGTVGVAETITSDGPETPLWSVGRAIAEGRHRVAIAANLAGLGGSPDTLPRLRTEPQGHRLHGRVDVVPYAADADSLAIRTRTRDGVALVLVSRDGPGVTVQHLDDLGLGGLYRVEFTGAPVVAGAVLSEPSLRHLLVRVLLRQAGYTLGLAQQAFDLTVEHTRRRKQFGQAIASFQHVSFQLAAVAARLYAARRLVHRLASDEELGRTVTHRAAAALAMVAELARETTATAMQLHGAYGFTEAAEVQQYYRQAAVESLLLGTPQQLRALAAQSLSRDE